MDSFLVDQAMRPKDTFSKSRNQPSNVGIQKYF